MARLNPVTLTRQRPRPEARFRKPVLVFDLWRESNELRLERAWRLHGRNAKTLAKRPDGTLLLEIVRAGNLVQPHVLEGAVTLSVLTGFVRVHFIDRVVELRSGHCLWVEPACPFGLEPVEDSTYTLFVTGAARAGRAKR